MYDYHKTTWINPNIEYLFNYEIIEYDVSDAGFSLIKEFQLLPPDKIRELERLGKGIERHVEIGKIQRDDKAFSEALNEKFAYVRNIFIQMNNLTDSDIISVKKDAIFTTKNCRKTIFGKVKFSDKNHYSSYIRFPNINNMEIYYGNNDLDIKGMSENVVNMHRLYMIQFLRKVFTMIEDKDPNVRRYVINFISDYKTNNLDSETYYLEFNNKSHDYNALYNYMNVLIPIVEIIQREII